jgi:tetratricopeptide (TPR) repeat protein
MDPYEIPEELSFLQALNMDKIGFEQDLLHGIEKIFNAKKIEPTLTTISTVGTGPSIVSLWKRGTLFLEEGDWKQADTYFNKVLDIDPEFAQAYMGKLCIEHKAKKEEDIFTNDCDYRELLHTNKNFKWARRFASGSTKDVYDGYYNKLKELEAEEERRAAAKKAELEIRQREEQERQLKENKRIEKERQVQLKHQQEEKRQKEIEKYDNTYQEAIRLGLEATDAAGYDKAINAFNSIENYKDSTEWIKYYTYQKAARLADYATTAGEYYYVVDCFDSIKYYKDSEQRRDYYENVANKIIKKEQTHSTIVLTIIVIAAILLILLLIIIGSGRQ